ncbi:hypothetical protein COCSUDRAFT_63560 [Coccomyxa subellipsoidea C-169]|uniref:Pali-domain-containing protein n=1 Tax=Coccomyxa subellipsoidea (strain C-169) TaxID=574566 RepID=I0YXT3_COCSC|nr:hypothetical protein COCSUDRAFT_63560 [Coccomyxa subellipsoidea C-169]EIE23202.1 hypothetical protein COCSUDRAFT_63560 [Coccomyxa subellipsoidea C-169]|eukprot:XP_005647746.1 hypothetical protein COCSUDRAFT_63560 [Coccomyxa subellipsoidea C-169]
MGIFGRRGKAEPYVEPAPRRQGCCPGISRVVCSTFLSITFLSIFGLSVAALVGFSRYWTYYTTNRSDPGAYNVQTGWLHFRTRDVDSSSLRDINFGLWVIGIICAAALAVSVVLSFAEFFASVTNQTVLWGILIAYIASAIFKVRDYTGNTVGTPFTVWPSWGWIIAIIASVLWFLAGIFASCMGPKRPRQALPTHTPTAGAAYPGAHPAGAYPAAPHKEKRGWFGRKKAGAAGATGAAAPGQQYNAQPFNQPNRDMEMGAVPDKGTRYNNGHNGHNGEALAAGGVGAAAGAAGARHHHNQDRAAGPGTGPLAAGAAAQEPKPKRGLFGFGKKRAAEPTPAAGAQPGYAAGEQGYARDQEYPREAPAAGAGNAQGGAWAGSRLTQEEEANRANLAGRDAAPRGGAVEPSAPAMTAAEEAPQKKGAFSFYH